MSHSFDRDELRYHYEDVERCGYCGQMKADCIHHIISRSRKYTNSILNTMPLCNHSCHLPFHGEHMKRENQEKFIRMTAQRLHHQGYKLKELDMKFLIEHNLLDIVKEIL